MINRRSIRLQDYDYSQARAYFVSLCPPNQTCLFGEIVIVITGAVRVKNFSPLHPCGTSKTIGSVVCGFKIGVTKWMRNNMPIYAIWQRNYWEHIVRNKPGLNRIRKYIRNNPAQ